MSSFFATPSIERSARRGKAICLAVLLLCALFSGACRNRNAAQAPEDPDGALMVAIATRPWRSRPLKGNLETIQILLDAGASWGRTAIEEASLLLVERRKEITSTAGPRRHTPIEQDASSGRRSGLAQSLSHLDPLELP